MTKGNLAQAIVLVLLLAAVGFVWIGEFRETRWEDCANPDRLADAHEIPGTLPGDEGRPAGGGDKLIFEWRKGLIRSPAGVVVGFQIMRTDRPLIQSANWSLKLARIFQPAKTWSERRNVDGTEIVVDWASQPAEYGKNYYVAHLEILGSEPVDSIFRAQLANAGRQIIEGTLPSTSYIIEAVGKPSEEAVIQATAMNWLEAVVRRNRRACQS